MDIALVADENGEADEIRDLHVSQVGEICERMREDERFSPVLVCPRGSRLASLAAEAGIPLFALGSRRNPFRLFRLWRWQRRKERLEILAIGSGAINVAHRLWKTRSPDASRLSFAFFFHAPDNDSRVIRALFPGKKFFCGSSRIADQVESLRGARVGLQIVPPGIDAVRYRLAEPRTRFDADNHFAFGMAGSLEPDSGALLVIRAMAAMWQKEDLPPWETRMFGSGPRYAEIAREAEALGVLSRLAILDDQPLSEVCALCQVWLAPGSAPDEPPQVLWAGAAADLPVVCSSSPLHEERLPAGAAVIRVEKNDPQQLARAMIALMRDPRRRAEMVEETISWKYRIGLPYMATTICDALGEGLAAEKDAAERSA